MKRTEISLKIKFFKMFVNSHIGNYIKCGSANFIDTDQ